MRHGARAVVLAALLPACALAAPLDALENADGWYTWQVEAAQDAPAWCCFGWRGERAAGRACDLDADHAWGTCRERNGEGGAVRVFAKLESGEAVKLRALSPGCRVESPAGIADLGEVEVGASFDWLRRQVEMGTRVSEDALAAIAVHGGERPLRYLLDAANGTADIGLREQAIFWLGQARIFEAAGTIERLMFSDEDPEIRRHAAFVLSQSKAPDRVAALIRQGRQDGDGETRAQAWFWLAQTGASRSEEAILRAIASDSDREVQEQAVFALSQLPGERAVTALLAVLRDKDQRQGVREQALFWLAQSESEQALAALEALLAGHGERY